VVETAQRKSQEKGLLPVVEARRAEAPTLTHDGNRYLVHQEVDQNGGASHQARIIFAIGLRQPIVERCDGGGTQLYPDAQGCIFLWGYSALGL
jgi:hypothetical protein